jgi:beta-mannanase
MSPSVDALNIEASNQEQYLGLYSLNNLNNENIFVNNVDGYSLKVDNGVSVDMSYSSVYTALENYNKRIEIFKQPLSGVSKSGYINYSNKFIQNTEDHKVEFNGYQTIAGRQVHILSWNRQKLQRVQNDKNYYLVLDISENGYMYTIFIKANNPIGNLGGYEYLLSNFNTFQPTKAPYTYKSASVNLEEKNWNQETRDFYIKYFSDAANLTWGIFEPSTAMFNYDQLNYLENNINYNFPIILNYSEFENTYKHPNLKQRLETAYKNGKTLELTLQTNWKAIGTGNMVYDVLSGEYDYFLRDYAMTIKDFGHPVLFRFGNEMNGDWCPYSGYNTSRDPMVFKELYKYIYSIFEEAGVNNAIWVWNPNAESFPDFKWNDTLMYYPGDEYVDVVGLTAYNTGNYYASTGEKWQEFDDLYGNLYNEYYRNFGQPLMISEFASATLGGDKTQWVTNMFQNIKYYSNIKVAIWWDGSDKDANGQVARSYFIDDPITVLEIFKKYLKKSWKLDSYA